MSLFRNAVSILTVSVVRVPLGLMSSIVLARYLSVSDRGAYSVLMAFIGLVALLSQVGWGQASIYRIRRVGVPPSHVATAAILASLFFSGVSIAICTALRGWLEARFFSGLGEPAFALALAVIPFQLLAVVFGAIARGLGRFMISNAYQLCFSASILVAMTLVLAVTHGSLLDALRAYLAIQVVTTLGLMAAVIRHTGLSLRIRPTELSESLSFGIRSYIQGIAGQLHERVDVFMLAYLLGDPTPVAFYAIATGFITRLKIVPDSVGQALFPQIAGISQERGGALVARVMRHSTFWVASSTMVFACVGPFLIPILYGAEYHESIEPFIVLLPRMALLKK